MHGRLGPTWSSVTATAGCLSHIEIMEGSEVDARKPFFTRFKATTPVHTTVHAKPVGHRTHRRLPTLGSGSAYRGRAKRCGALRDSAAIENGSGGYPQGSAESKLQQRGDTAFYVARPSSTMAAQSPCLRVLNNVLCAL